MELLRQVVRLARAGEPLALCTVIATSGSTPRHPGARMAVRPDGTAIGTIGGGRVELEVIELGARVAAGEAPQRVRHHLVRDLAMCCGGSMEFYVQPIAPSLDTFEGVVALWEKRRPALLITPLAGAPARLEEIGDPAVVAPAPRLATEVDEFVEPVLPRPRLILFGAGHVARAVGPLARSVDFEIVVCDDGSTGALDLVPAWAHRSIASFEPSDVEREAGALGFADYVVIMTRDHGVDQRILEKILPDVERLSYLGVIGSRGKLGRFHKRLEARGIATPERWAKVHGPIGVDIGAETPAEIAVSVVAELIAIRNAGRRS